jgi:hypothetical protein
MKDLGDIRDEGWQSGRASDTPRVYLCSIWGGELCIFNAIAHTGIAYDIQS